MVKRIPRSGRPTWAEANRYFLKMQHYQSDSAVKNRLNSTCSLMFVALKWMLCRLRRKWEFRRACYRSTWSEPTYTRGNCILTSTTSKRSKWSQPSNITRGLIKALAPRRRQPRTTTALMSRSAKPVCSTSTCKIIRMLLRRRVPRVKTWFRDSSKTAAWSITTESSH